MNTSNKSKKAASRTPLILIVAAVVVVGVAIAGILFLNKKTSNYAEEVARPLEQALISRGATKQCSRGDAGLGSDNVQPWYQAYFGFPKSEDQAIALVNNIAKENGHSLIHASPANRGPLGVADKFIDKWYFDNTSKASLYGDLQEGKIDLSVAVNADGLASACSTGIVIDSGHSAIGIEVRLPNVKR
ncbi:MAG TPA: hypothetical protein VJM32_05465 [Candidatus Saccharimonadales bacterium]|nr:hypothetical protein [Candidatus Saccharimonadales bacterium]